MTESDLTPERLAELINEGFAMYDEMCIARHQKGQQEYGTFTHLENNTIEMAMEELADASNYLRYMFAKLYILNILLSERYQGSEIPIGPQSFKPASEGGQ